MSARHTGRKTQLPPAPQADPRDQAIAAADAQLARAKHRTSLACLSCLRASPDAPQMVRRALEEIEGARKVLASVYEER